MGDDNKKDVLLDTTSSAFNPKVYIGRVCANASRRDFQDLIYSLTSEAEETDEAIQQLLRDSVDTLVGSKEALDAMQSNNASLFGGGAVDALAESFSKALGDGESLVAPTMELFQRLSACKATRERLAKFITVWRVPGEIYQHCGARVPVREVGPPLEHQRLQESQDDQMTASRVSRVSRAHSICETEDDRDDIYSSAPASVFQQTTIVSAKDDNTSTKDGDEDEDKQLTCRLSRGALEEYAFVNDDGCYVLQPDEELIHWYGTPLARRCKGDATDGRSNFEAAVHSLRHAMVYLEGHCDLENAVMLGTECVRDIGNTSALFSADPEAQQQTGSITFMYQYALALLRSALYLSEQMALELQHVSATDTVLIENVLSGMMDVAIATVKLRHFCWSARGKLPTSVNQEEAMLGLQQQLQCWGSNNDDSDEEDESEEDDMEEDETDEPSARQYMNKDAPGNGFRTIDYQIKNVTSLCPDIDPWSPSNDTGELKTKMEHPVEYYLRIIRNQHVRIMESTARCLSMEAKEWLRKFAPNDNGDGDIDNCANTESLPSHPPAGENIDLDFAGTFTRNFVDGLSTSRDFGEDTCYLKETATMFSSCMNIPLEALCEGTVSERVKVGGFGVDVDDLGDIRRAEAILDAFRTPEADFPRFTKFSIGKVDMGDVLECSAAQLRMFSASLLSQLEDRMGVDINIQTHIAAGTATTLTDRLFGACVDHLEVVFVSYWGGIAEEVHSGRFDFSPDPSSMLYRMLNGPAVRATTNAPSAACSQGVSAAKTCVVELPPLRYIPITEGSGPSLRELSVKAVRQVVRVAGDVLQALFLAHVNRTVLQCFVRTMSSYRVGDLISEDDGNVVHRETNDYEDEHAELHAAVLVEVIIAQWEKLMLQVTGAVRRMKVVVGESCASSLAKGSAQAQQVGELLQELEELRSNLFGSYMHGVGMLVKAYVTLLPSLQPSVAKASASIATGDAGKGTNGDDYNINDGDDATVCGSVCARISRGHFSSVLTNKLLNLISVVVDRIAPFLQRFDEVHCGNDLFAAKTTLQDGDDEPNRRKGRDRSRFPGENGKSRENENNNPRRVDGVGRQSDTVSTFVVDSNSELVLQHVAEHEKMLLALIANTLLVFVDALHHKCQRVSLVIAASHETFERAIMESLADVLSLSAAVTPIITNELVIPCILDVTVRLNSDPKTPHGTVLIVKQKTVMFRKAHLTRVEEHCQLLVDALVGMFVTAPQQRITRVVQTAGFIRPMMDWQRASPLTAGAVRPYVARSLALIARAHEQMQWLEQSILAATVTQRLVAHLALAFVTAMTADGNAFEISLDCSSNFLTYGLLLIEAEGRTILSVTNAVIQSVMENACAGNVLPDLVAACGVLERALEALERRGSAVSGPLEEKSLWNAHSSVKSPQEEAVMTSSYRAERCQAMVEGALQNSSFIVEAMLTHLRDNAHNRGSLATAFAPSGSSVAEIVSERLAKRKEGYRRGEPPRQSKEKDVRFVQAPNAIPESSVAEPVGSSAMSRRSTRRKSRKGGEDNNQLTTNDSMTHSYTKGSLMAERLSVLRRAVGQEERRAAETDAAVSKVKQQDSRSKREDAPAQENELAPDATRRRVSQRRRSLLSSSRIDGENFLNSIASPGSVGGKSSTRTFKRSLFL